MMSIHGLDHQAPFRYASSAFQRVAGINPRDVLGRGLTDLIAPEDHGIVQQALLKVNDILVLSRFRLMLGPCLGQDFMGVRALQKPNVNRRGPGAKIFAPLQRQLDADRLPLATSLDRTRQRF